MASYKHLLDKRKHDFCPKIVNKFDKNGYKDGVKLVFKESLYAI